jgi:hypothetical protein
MAAEKVRREDRRDNFFIVQRRRGTISWKESLADVKFNLCNPLITCISFKYKFSTCFGKDVHCACVNTISRQRGSGLLKTKTMKGTISIK